MHDLCPSLWTGDLLCGTAQGLNCVAAYKSWHRVGARAVGAGVVGARANWGLPTQVLPGLRVRSWILRKLAPQGAAFFTLGRASPVQANALARLSPQLPGLNTWPYMALLRCSSPSCSGLVLSAPLPTFGHMALPLGLVILQSLAHSPPSSGGPLDCVWPSGHSCLMPIHLCPGAWMPVPSLPAPCPSPPFPAPRASPGPAGLKVPLSTVGFLIALLC